jgi:hypothetical protein
MQLLGRLMETPLQPSMASIESPGSMTLSRVLRSIGILNMTLDGPHSRLLGRQMVLGSPVYLDLPYMYGFLQNFSEEKHSNFSYAGFLE